LIECEDYNIKLLKEYPCCNKKQLDREEGYWTLHYKEQTDYTCVNKHIAGRTIKEWREANKECLAEKHKEYRQINKEKIASKHKEWREANPEYNKEWREANPEYGKEYREANKDHIAEYRKEWSEANPEYHKEYYEANKEHLTAYKKEKHECVCGGKYTTCSKATHEKSNRHQDYIKSKNK